MDQHDEHSDNERGTVGYGSTQPAPAQQKHSSCPHPAEEDAQRERRDDEGVAGHASNGQGEVGVADAQYLFTKNVVSHCC